MKFSYFALIVILLLSLYGCDEKTSAANSQTEAISTQSEELSPEEEIAKLQKKAEAGDVKSQWLLGIMYGTGEGAPKDAVKAAEWYQKAAAQGDASAQYLLAGMYANGEGVSKDAAKAVEWYQKAAAQDDTDAQNKLGEIYSKGKGVPKDATKAVEWYQKAAAQGNADAQYRLGMMYGNGKGVPLDIAKAMELYQKAAEQGFVDAQKILADMYFDGKGVSKDAAMSVEWLQKAAAQGDADAQCNLAVMYEKGYGVPKNDVKAVEWLQKAAAQGDARAQFFLGWMYEKGQGVSKDRVQSYAWYNLAAAQGAQGEGGANVKTYRDDLEKLLTAAEHLEGQQLASNWKHGDTLLVSSSSSSSTASPNDKPSKQNTGTAFTVSSDGHALTNHHVINGCSEVKIAGRDGVAKVITSDSVNDLALLQLPGKSDDIAKLNPDPGKLRQGEDIIVFGYPLNFVLSSGGNLTPGTISALTGLGNNTNQIQITAPIQPGSSGSPVMDKKGNVVGVVSMMLDDRKMAKVTGQAGQNVNFAVNGQTVRAFLDANNVPYKTGGGLFSLEKNNADIADEARKWTVLVECWK